MRDAGLIVPEFLDLRLNEAAAMTDELTRQSNYEGMRDRLQRGDNREPVPEVVDVTPTQPFGAPGDASRTRIRRR